MRSREAQFRLIFRLLAQSLLLALVMTLPCAIAVNGQDSAERKRVLIVFSNDAYTQTQTTIDRALRATLKSGSPVPIEFYSEYVGDTRASSDYDKEFVALMKRKYEGKKFDLIFALPRTPLRILTSNRTELFPNTPIVFLTHDRRFIEGL